MERSKIKLGEVELITELFEMYEPEVKSFRSIVSKFMFSQFYRRTALQATRQKKPNSNLVQSEAAAKTQSYLTYYGACSFKLC